MARYVDIDKLIADGWHLERHGESGRLLQAMSLADVQTEDVAPRSAVLAEIFEYVEKESAKRPLYVGLADLRCPNCHEWVPFDRLNGKIENAPKRCAECGQTFTWKGGD